MTNEPVAHASGTFTIGGDLTVHRLGFGTMRLTGNGIWGPPDDRAEAIRVLRRAVELGIDFFDTANSYGPYVAEELIREALHPYRDDLVVATKAGLLRTGENEWTPLGFPAYLRQEVEMSLRRLGTDRIDLFQLHRIDSKFPAEDQVGELAALQKEGKIRHIGLSEITVDQLTAAQKVTPIASVQNRYNMAERGADPLLEACEAQNIAFIPVGATGLRATGRRRRPAAADRVPAPHQAVAAGRGLAAQAVTRHDPDPRHVARRAPRRERVGSRGHAHRRGVRRAQRARAVATGYASATAQAIR